MKDAVRVNSTDFKLEEQYDALGRSSGYTLWRGANAMHVVQTGYDAQGRISSASFRHAGEDKNFGFEYLAGTHLRSRLNMPNGMNVRHLYEANRNLASHINDYRGDTGVSLREYTYDTLNRPATRKYSRQGTVRNDVLSYNSRNELVGATIGADAYAYDFDNIGNRKSAAEQGEDWSYLSNELNQYARITQAGTLPAEPVIFTPQYDADGNQTLLQTQTGIWSVTYDAFNRPIRFTSQDETVIIESSYDSMGRRVNKKVTQNGAVTLHQRYLYRGYLQIACIDMTRSGLNGMWMITWDPTQASATRPLALQKDGTWFCYGTDLSKNITEVYKNNGTIATAYTYAPFGQVVASGSTTQPLQWSSEYYDTELGLVYYNYRHYNPKDGRWINRDPIGIEGGYNLYAYVGNSAEWLWDVLGLAYLAVRPLHRLMIISEDGTKCYALMGKIYSAKGLSLQHSHFFFEDGTNIGYFDDGTLREDDVSDVEKKTYMKVRGNLNDCVLREAIKLTPPKPYSTTRVQLRFQFEQIKVPFRITLYGPIGGGSTVLKDVWIISPDLDNCNSWADRVLKKYDELIMKSK